MPEQKFCAKCGKVNWSYFAKTCECRKPDFKYSTYEEYDENERMYTVFKGNDLYGIGRIDHIQSLIRGWLDDHMHSKSEVTFKVIKKERL